MFNAGSSRTAHSPRSGTPRHRVRPRQFLQALAQLRVLNPAAPARIARFGGQTEVRVFAAPRQDGVGHVARPVAAPRTSAPCRPVRTTTLPMRSSTMKTLGRSTRTCATLLSGISPVCRLKWPASGRITRWSLRMWIEEEPVQKSANSRPGWWRARQHARADGSRMMLPPGARAPPPGAAGPGGRREQQQRRERRHQVQPRLALTRDQRAHGHLPLRSGTSCAAAPPAVSAGARCAHLPAPVALSTCCGFCCGVAGGCALPAPPAPLTLGSSSRAHTHRRIGLRSRHRVCHHAMPFRSSRSLLRAARLPGNEQDAQQPDQSETEHLRQEGRGGEAAGRAHQHLRARRGCSG